MPVELVLSPLMRPVVLAKALVFSPHRRASRYVPHIVDSLSIDTISPEGNDKPYNIQEFAIRRRFGSGSKIFDVFDTKNGELPIGSNNFNDSLFWFVRSRSVKGAYKMYSQKIRNTGIDDQGNIQDEPVAAIRAGLRSNILLIRAPDIPVSELGWHVINHRVDALDAYRMFTLNDGSTYQWTTEGMFLEKISNLGEKESEIRERIGQVIPAANFGFNIKINLDKIPLELALSSALCSYIDHWNTNLKVGGIYYARQSSHVRWKRD